jgi:hypothetical protein
LKPWIEKKGRLFSRRSKTTDLYRINDFHFHLSDQINGLCTFRWCISNCLSRVRAIEEKFQSARNAVITDFKSMLRECKDIISTSRWTKVSSLYSFHYTSCNKMKWQRRQILFM